ncbi:penicillin-binding protein 2 [Atopomonas sediminilitoris]|uniref:penicillin-binding protein 2 n=1 Tax=Atopomonas sediminilitoris TaxID=2919919 RepID=UPI001F4D53DD|nr:penicillin-binding protein 2 [Atopomonas sediminilitoris]MCJ8170618.1 penicillin-binding protein 2 [Atopomonas sediminilitoris]
MASPIRLKDHERDARVVRARIWVGALLVLILVSVLFARLYHLQVTQYEHHSTLSESNRVHLLSIPPSRGLIFDRNGKIIADNRASFSLTLTRERAGSDWPTLLDDVVEVLALTPSERRLFEKRVRQGRRPFEPVPFIFNLTEEQIARIAVNQYRLPGIEVQANLVRYYPFKEHFAHSVGYVGRINEQELKQLDPVNYSGTHHIGKTGIEYFYEDQLHGEVGYEEVETNARGRVMRVLKRTDPTPGADLHLYMDADLQEVAEQALGGRRGAVVAIEPSTGGILALVSQPGYDPNLFVTGISFGAYAELRDSIDRPLFNRVLRGSYPPGSTIKPIVALAGLDSGVITPQSRVFDPGFYKLPNVKHLYRNWNRTGDGWVDVNMAIYRSNDTYFYDLAHKLGIDRLADYMKAFGLGQRVSVDLSREESEGLVPSRQWKRAVRNQSWYPGETLIAGIGQGYMLSTPMQLAQATAVLANRGQWVRPRMVRTLQDQALVVDDTPPDVSIKDPQNWDRVIAGMENVLHFPRGTAYRVGSTAAYRMAGKSGTAQVVAIRQGEKYDRTKINERHRDHALFIAFAPVDAPRIAVAVMVENGESGSGVAAPVVKKIIDAWLLNAEGQVKETTGKVEYFPPPPPVEEAHAQ